MRSSPGLFHACDRPGSAQSDPPPSLQGFASSSNRATCQKVRLPDDKLLIYCFTRTVCDHFFTAIWWWRRFNRKQGFHECWGSAGTWRKGRRVVLRLPLEHRWFVWTWLNRSWCSLVYTVYVCTLCGHREVQSVRWRCFWPTVDPLQL